MRTFFDASAPTSKDGLGHAQRLGIRFHLMDADDTGSLLAGIGSECYGGPVTVRHVRAVEHLADHRLA